MWDKIHQIILDLEPLLLVVIPTCFAVYLKLKSKVVEKKHQIEKENESKNKEKFSDWEHAESLAVIDKIKTICNYYRDVGHMDLANYIQFENGTTATSKICNMFLSCLAEDSRFSNIPKMISSIQRVPYSRLSTWINNTINAKEERFIVNKREVEFKEDYSDFIVGSEKVKSFISGTVRDPNGTLIGICSFFFDDENLCGDDKESRERCMSVFNNFVTSVETVFIEYHTTRNKKKKELNIL